MTKTEIQEVYQTGKDHISDLLKVTNKAVQSNEETEIPEGFDQEALTSGIEALRREMLIYPNNQTLIDQLEVLMAMQATIDRINANQKPIEPQNIPRRDEYQAAKEKATPADFKGEKEIKNPFKPGLIQKAMKEIAAKLEKDSNTKK